MVTALYRRYRPDTFADLIGQGQVTQPLMTALRTNRVNHAYLFSGPRGCGKTTSARILARCLNCVEGPTDTPCGVCPSCVELSTGGQGSLDVVEIDAASHGGVDDARDLRERAIFAPARDRYKVFIIDEAHMVTAGGFNALLKIVEEPPEHVTFIFATTEPEKVIGTIRSRTHHYPFRLVPPATMLPFLTQICESEQITAEPGVLPLVIRAGGGSVRDTLSVLDQLIAGSEGSAIAYQRTTALLGYTPAELLTRVVDALSVRDATSLFTSVDRVIETGQDPRRFVEDLLDRLRDLIVVAAVGSEAGGALQAATEDEVAELMRQASAFGGAQLARAAAVANATLTAMVGATSPRMHLELMCARLLLPESDDTSLGTLSRLDRLERRLGIEPVAGREQPSTVSSAPTPTSDRLARATPSEEPASGPQSPGGGAAAGESPQQDSEPPQPLAGPADGTPPAVPQSEGAGAAPMRESANALAEPAAAPVAPVSADQVRASWSQVVDYVETRSRVAWTAISFCSIVSYEDDVLTLSFPSNADAEKFRSGRDMVAVVRDAIAEVLGIRVKFRAHVNPDAEPSAPALNSASASVPRVGDSAVAEAGWDASAPIENRSVQESEPASAPESAAPDAPQGEPAAGLPSAESESAAAVSAEDTAHHARYGEAVIRDLLKAKPINDERGH